MSRSGTPVRPAEPATGARGGQRGDVSGVIAVSPPAPESARFVGVDEEISMAEYDQELDACGLSCPLPILRAKKALSRMASGQILRVIATDPGSVKDFEAFSRQTGNELLESNEDDGRFYYRLRKA